MRDPRARGRTTAGVAGTWTARAAALLALTFAAGATRARAEDAPGARPPPADARPAAPRDPGPARVTRRDLAVALRAFEEAWRAAPPTDAATRRDVAGRVSRATVAFFVGAGASALDGLHEAAWLVPPRGAPARPAWSPAHAALARTRVRLPAVSVVPDGAAGAPADALLVALPPVPSPFPAVRATGRWPRPPRCGGPGADGSAPVEAFPFDGRPAALPRRAVDAGPAGRCDGIRRLDVRLVADGSPAVEVTTWGETCVVLGDPAPRLDAAKARLAAVPASVAAPPGLRPTLERYVARVERALRDEVDEVLVDVPDELRRLEEGVAALEAAARTGTPVRPDRAALVGDHHRVTARGATYRVDVPPPAPGRPDAPLPLVVALHGMGGTEDMFFEAYGAGAAVREARARGFVLASPEDVDTAADVVEDLRTLLPIDATRVYGVGHSMGAGALLRAAVRQPDLFAALAPIAGGWMSVSSPTWSSLASTPILAVTAEQDFGRAITERTARAAKAAGVPVDLRVLADLDHLLVVGEALPGVFAFFDGKARALGPR